MIMYYRECVMLGNPESKGDSVLMTSPKVSNMAEMVPTGRSLSANGFAPEFKTSYQTVSSDCLSPGAVASLMKSSNTHLPPTSGSRQLSKLKRFLTTLQQFGSDISPQIGERVRALVLGLVNSHLSIEDFHAKLQQATNFPLKPFVIPFLKANLPLLQRELLYCARLAKQSPQQFLTQNEHMMFSPVQSPLSLQESLVLQVNENGKRRLSDSGSHDDRSDFETPAKRHHSNQCSSPGSAGGQSPDSVFSVSVGASLRLQGISKSRGGMEHERLERGGAEVEADRERHYQTSLRRTETFDHCERFSDDWQHVESLLGCILSMVDKTKRAVSVLRDRSLQDREDVSLWSHHQPLSVGEEPVMRALRHSGDAVCDVRRRAVWGYWPHVQPLLVASYDMLRGCSGPILYDTGHNTVISYDVVVDVGRQAMLELQQAVTSADQKASDLVMAETLRMERAVADVRAQVHSKLLQSVYPQEESAESCWNCGRKASETCSGCNMARYCGSFCQHKDWDNHHHVCGRAHVTSTVDLRPMPRRTSKISMVAGLGSGTKGQQTSSSKEFSAVDHSSYSCTSPQPSAVPCLSTKDEAQTPTAPAMVSSTRRSVSASPGTSVSTGTPSPACLNPDNSTTDADTSVTSQTLSETSAT